MCLVANTTCIFGLFQDEAKSIKWVYSVRTRPRISDSRTRVQLWKSR
jgi:hypothetical protein